VTAERTARVRRTARGEKRKSIDHGERGEKQGREPETFAARSAENMERIPVSERSRIKRPKIPVIPANVEMTGNGMAVT
jgi:hypothetical protein